MKYITSSLIALSFALTAAQAHAQDAATSSPQDQGASGPILPDKGAPPATPAPSTDAAPAVDAPTQDAAPAAQAAAPDTSADAQATATVSDAEVDQFAKATVEVQKINRVTKLDEAAKQTQMAEAVKAAGLEPARFNEIGQALAADTALREKVQMAMAKYAGPSKG
jgi:hypothetical protein